MKELTLDERVFLRPTWTELLVLRIDVSEFIRLVESETRRFEYWLASFRYSSSIVRKVLFVCSRH
jgi:hypothetical protein